VQREVLAGQGRRRCHGQLELRQGRRWGSQAQVGAGLAQVGDQPGFLVAVELAGTDHEDPRQCDEHSGGDRALVGLDLGQVAGGQAQQFRAGVQRQGLLLAQRADLGADEQFVAHVVLQFHNFADLRKFIRPFLQAPHRWLGAK
jgi:hypothetical protein